MDPQTAACQMRNRLLFERPRANASMIELVQHLLAAVAELMERARTLFYAVMLSGHACPGCGGRLAMIREGHCRCAGCAREFDPTIAFQECSACGGRLRVRIRRYECHLCGAPVRSHFLFDGLVFDAAYFRDKMAEHRKRKRAQRERVRQMLAANRSPIAEIGPAELEEFAALQAALDEMTRSVESPAAATKASEFDLHRYERHVEAQCRGCVIALTDIPPLIKDPHRDVIYRFIALIFLAHTGVVRVWQEGRDILVTHRETHAER